MQIITRPIWKKISKNVTHRGLVQRYNELFEVIRRSFHEDEEDSERFVSKIALPTSDKEAEVILKKKVQGQTYAVKIHGLCCKRQEHPTKLLQTVFHQPRDDDNDDDGPASDGPHVKCCAKASYHINYKYKSEPQAMPMKGYDLNRSLSNWSCEMGPFEMSNLVRNNEGTGVWSRTQDPARKKKKTTTVPSFEQPAAVRYLIRSEQMLAISLVSQR
ncbi:hypothetical protein ACLOJK_032482 [Asimina triloba]